MLTGLTSSAVSDESPSGAGGDGGARQHHEVGVAARDIERIVRLQRNEHGAAAALVDEVEAVIEELAEQGEPRVERRRQAFVRRDVGQVDVVALHLDAEGLQSGIADDTGRFQVGHGDRVRSDGSLPRASRPPALPASAACWDRRRRVDRQPPWHSASPPAPDIRRRRLA